MLRKFNRLAVFAAFVALVPIAFMPDVASACPRCQQAQVVQAQAVQAQAVIQQPIVQQQVVTAVQPLAVVGAVQPLCGRAARINARQVNRASRRCRGGVVSAQILTTAAVVGVQQQPQIAPPQNFELVPQQSGVTVQTPGAFVQVNPGQRQQYQMVPANPNEEPTPAPAPEDATADERATAQQAPTPAPTQESVVTAVPQAPVPQFVPQPIPQPAVSSGVTFELVEVAPAVPATYQLRAMASAAPMASFTSFAAAPLTYASYAMAAPVTYAMAAPVTYATYAMPATFSTFATASVVPAVGLATAPMVVGPAFVGGGRRHRSVAKTVVRTR